MEYNGWLVVGAGAIAASVILGVVVLNRRRGGSQSTRASMKLGGVQMTVDSSSEITPGVRGEDLESKSGKIVGHDRTGRGVHLKKAVAKGDIDLKNEVVPGQEPDPKG